jgi:hypothetical protein
VCLPRVPPRFLQVRLPDGSGPVLMRFWDPRVLGVLLDHAEPHQRHAILKDMRFWVEVDRLTMAMFDHEHGFARTTHEWQHVFLADRKKASGT